MIPSLQKATSLLVIVGFLAVTGCATETETEVETLDTTAAQMESDMARATATLEPTQGNNASGEVTFTEDQGGVHVQGRITNLSEGQHGFHIHENGDCSAPDASSAGGHFNPTNAQHGAPSDPQGQHHIGDMGNIMANASGTAIVDTTFDYLTLNGQNSIIGRAVIVHQGADDLTSQPSGDAGPRLACGVIDMQAPEGIENVQEDTLGSGLTSPDTASGL